MSVLISYDKIYPLEVNKTYIKTIGELKGRSFLIEEAIKQK